MENPSSAGRRVFFATLLITLTFRTVLAARLPITGDEAYFYFWGRYPAFGFYDHPPMVGWWLAALRQISDHPLMLRLPALLAPVFIAWLVRRMLRPRGDELAWQAATLILLLPLNAWNVAITTDVPLMVFGFATVAWYLRALRSGRAVDFVLCGLLLGGALLSKYFAGLLALAIAGHLLWPSERRSAGARLRALLLVIAGALPQAIAQVYWNSQHCWPNVMFNLVNRHDTAGWSLKTPPLYLVSLVYVLTPLVLWGVLRHWRAQPAGDERGAGERDHDGRPVHAGIAGERGYAALEASALRWFVGLPFGVFALLSAVKRIGLHWLAAFTAPAVLLFFRHADAGQRRAALRFAAGFALAHYLLIVGLAAAPLQWFARLSSYPGLVMTLAPQALNEALAPWRGRFAIASDGYSAAVTMGFNLGEYVFVFGPGSSHARHDDMLTDLRELEGRDILIVRKEADRGQDDERYFERVERKVIEVRGVRFHLTEGHGFRYPVYRDVVLDEIRRRWYQVPSWLPSGPCYFCDRYFPERACHR